MNDQKPTVAMIDDDKNFIQIMAMKLSEAFSINSFTEPEEAISYLGQTRPDAVLLDLHMNEHDGFSVCRKIKSVRSEVPVFFLTSDVETENIAKSFETGSIDYFSKFMNPDEIICRIQSRLKTLIKKSPSELRCREILLDTVSRRVWIKNQEVIFSPKEFDLLKVFMEHQDEVLPKKKIQSLLWKDVTVNANNIDTHMFHIRKKFAGLCTGIECRKAAGYILRSDA
jgi:DNA-binding response OmpR family regulator